MSVSMRQLFEAKELGPRPSPHLDLESWELDDTQQVTTGGGSGGGKPPPGGKPAHNIDDDDKKQEGGGGDDKKEEGGEKGPQPVDANGKPMQPIDDHDVDPSKIKVEGVSPRPNSTAKSPEEMREKLRQAIDNAQEYERGQSENKKESEAGVGTGGLRGYIERQVNPSVNWKSILKNAMARSKKKIDWRRSSRRGMAVRSFIPKTKKLEEPNNVAIAIDTSGSMTSEEISYIVAEALTMLKLYPGVGLDVIFWTGDVYLFVPFKKATVKKLRDLTSRIESGGTNLGSVARYYETHGIRKPKTMIYFTDGYIEGGEVDILDDPTENFYLIVNDGDVTQTSKLRGKTFRVRLRPKPTK